MTPERRSVTEVRIQARETMFVLDGGADAELPSGSGAPIVACPEAIFVAGRVAADAATLVRIGSRGGQRDLVRAYAGDLATPERVLRLVNVTGDVLVEVPVTTKVTPVEIFLTDFDEPDEIFVALANESALTASDR
jgi:hypothetical protein